MMGMPRRQCAVDLIRASLRQSDGYLKRPGQDRSRQPRRSRRRLSGSRAVDSVLVDRRPSWSKAPQPTFSCSDVENTRPGRRLLILKQRAQSGSPSVSRIVPALHNAVPLSQKLGSRGSVTDLIDPLVERDCGGRLAAARFCRPRCLRECSLELADVPCRAADSSARYRRAIRSGGWLRLFREYRELRALRVVAGNRTVGRRVPGKDRSDRHVF